METRVYISKSDIILMLPSVSMNRPDDLPKAQGIYFVSGTPEGHTERQILYIGQTTDFRRRWNQGHTFYQRTYTIQWVHGGQPLIHYQEVSDRNSLDRLEREYILALKPLYNRAYNHSTGQKSENAPKGIKFDPDRQLLYGYDDKTRSQQYIQEVMAASIY